MKVLLCFITATTLLLMAATPVRGMSQGYTGEIQLPRAEVEKWSEMFSHTITSLSRELTDLDYLHKVYSINHIEEIKGNEILTTIAEDIENLLKRKVRNVERLVKTAESSYENYTFDSELDFEFLNSKKLLSTSDNINSTVYSVEEIAQKIRTINLTAEGKFNYMPVNNGTSTVQVPTTVFDRSTQIMNGAYWTEKMDKTFASNYDEEESQTWQYFCSTDGFFRVFPGMKWPRDNKDNRIDFFDCRVRSWYLQAAPGPKNVVILVDVSGSMKGLRMIIAQSTVKQILNTLDDDDYFNIIRFSADVNYVDPCFNDSLNLMAATKENKRLLLELIEEDVKAAKQANIRKAFEEVFDLFERLEDSLRYTYGPLCNKAILLITDGVSEHHAKIFEQRNWPDKRIRVFTFLIGRDVKDDREVKWMACANKGYYSHISTLADVQENVQNYIRVLSRPMVIHRAHNLIWTSVYLDHFSSLNAKKGLKFMTTVAMPVFDMKNDTRREGNLLGVMGTDVPIDLLQELAPAHKLGVNGFAFMINHNGYVLFHPDFNPYRRDLETENRILNPNFSNMDLTDIILPENKIEFNSARENMLNSRQGSLELTILQHYDNMRRMAKRKYIFYYRKIMDANFSLGIALPTTFDTRNNVKLHKSLRKALNSSNILIAPWIYCNNIDRRLRGKERIEKLLETAENDVLRKKHCNEDLLQLLHVDIDFTEGVHKNWSKHGNEYKASWSETDMPDGNSTFGRGLLGRNGIELIFFGSKAGLTRYLYKDNKTIPSYLVNRTSTLDALYYKRAVEGRERLASKHVYNFTFALTSSEGFNSSTSTMLITAPVVVEQDSRVDVSGVVGMLMKYKNFERLYIDSFQGFRKMNCSHPFINCYLVDDHGYVLASNKFPDERVTKFLGSIDGALMWKLIERKVFVSYNFTDYQAMCPIKDDDTHPSSSSTLLNPLKMLFRGLLSTITEIALFLSEFSFTHLIQQWTQVAGEAEYDSIMSPENFCDYDLNWMNSMEILAFTQLNSFECLNRHKVIGHKPCHKKFTLYHVNFNKLSMSPLNGTIDGCQYLVGCPPNDENCTDYKKDPYVEQCVKRRQNRYVQKRRACGDYSKIEDATKCDGVRRSISAMLILICILFSSYCAR